MKTILYSVPYGYFARNLLRTGVRERLLASPEIELVIVSPAHADQGFVSEFADHGRVRFAPHPEVRTTRNLVERAYWKAAVETWKRPVAAPLHTALRSAYERVYPRLYAQPYRPLLERTRPDLVITASPGNISPMDGPLIRDAQARGIPTLCLVFSWDNMSGAKGLLPAMPDHLGVWNERQRREAVDLHHYAPERVTVLGAPHFDLYQRPDTFLSRAEFCAKLGLDPAKRIVTAIVASMTASENTYMLDMLLAARASGRLGADTQILCRLHPRVRPDKNRRDYARYLGRTDIVIDIPDNYLDSIKWNPTVEEMRHLANTIKHSDVIMNIASTVTIEAALCDTPVVNLGFSTSEPEKFRANVIGRYWVYHYRYVRESRSTTFAMSEDEAIAAINRYLADPALQREERRKLAAELCGPLDGRSTERTGALIFRLLGIPPTVAAAEPGAFAMTSPAGGRR